MTKVTLIEYFDPHSKISNGIENILHSFLRADSEIQWEILGASHSNSLLLGCLYNVYGIENVKFIPVCYSNRSKKSILPNSLRLSIGLLRYRKIFAPTLIHTHRIELGFIAALLWPKSKRIQFLHNEAAKLASRLSSSAWKYFGAVQRVVEQYAVKHSDKVIIFNSKETDRISKQYSKNSKIFRAYTWYDDEVFFRKKLESVEVDSNTMKIAWVGRFEFEKNPIFAVEIATEFRNRSIDFKLIMVGEGSLLAECMKRVKDSKVNEHVVFTGNLNATAISEIFRESDVYLSTSFYEGSPTTLLEALACGVPSVCSVGADPDNLIDPGVQGFKVEDYSKEDFMKSIIMAKGLRPFEVQNDVWSRRKNYLVPKLLELSTSLD